LYVCTAHSQGGSFPGVLGNDCNRKGDLISRNDRSPRETLNANPSSLIQLRSGNAGVKSLLGIVLGGLNRSLGVVRQPFKLSYGFSGLGVNSISTPRETGCRICVPLGSTSLSASVVNQLLSLVPRGFHNGLLLGVYPPLKHTNEDYSRSQESSYYLRPIRSSVRVVPPSSYVFQAYKHHFVVSYLLPMFGTLLMIVGLAGMYLGAAMVSDLLREGTIFLACGSALIVVGAWLIIYC
jgi:hypothetical protein